MRGGGTCLARTRRWQMERGLLSIISVEGANFLGDLAVLTLKECKQC